MQDFKHRWDVNAYELSPGHSRSNPVLVSQHPIMPTRFATTRIHDSGYVRVTPTTEIPFIDLANHACSKKEQECKAAKEADASIVDGRAAAFSFPPITEHSFLEPSKEPKVLITVEMPVVLANRIVGYVVECDWANQGFGQRSGRIGITGVAQNVLGEMVPLNRKTNVKVGSVPEKLGETLWRLALADSKYASKAEEETPPDDTVVPISIFCVVGKAQGTTLHIFNLKLIFFTAEYVQWNFLAGAAPVGREEAVKVVAELVKSNDDNEDVTNPRLNTKNAAVLFPEERSTATQVCADDAQLKAKKVRNGATVFFIERVQQSEGMGSAKSSLLVEEKNEEEIEHRGPPFGAGVMGILFHQRLLSAHWKQTSRCPNADGLFAVVECTPRQLDHLVGWTFGSAAVSDHIHIPGLTKRSLRNVQVRNGAEHYPECLFSELTTAVGDFRRNEGDCEHSGVEAAFSTQISYFVQNYLFLSRTSKDSLAQTFNDFCCNSEARQRIYRKVEQQGMDCNWYRPTREGNIRLLLRFKPIIVREEVVFVLWTRAGLAFHPMHMLFVLRCVRNKLTSGGVTEINTPEKKIFASICKNIVDDNVLKHILSFLYVDINAAYTGDHVRFSDNFYTFTFKGFGYNWKEDSEDDG